MRNWKAGRVGGRRSVPSWDSGGTNSYGNETDPMMRPEVYGVDLGQHGFFWQWDQQNIESASYWRTYHNVALLLPDGTVWTTGGNFNWSGSDCCNGANCAQGEYGWFYDGTCNAFPNTRLRGTEIFRPWYAQPGVNRPTITNFPNPIYNSSGSTTVSYNIHVGQSQGNQIQKVALMRTGSVTHNFDVDQRHIWLEITGKSAGIVTIKMPPVDVAPPGVYMLFVLRHDGGSSPHVPSVARFTRVAGAL